MTSLGSLTAKRRQTRSVPVPENGTNPGLRNPGGSPVTSSTMQSVVAHPVDDPMTSRTTEVRSKARRGGVGTLAPPPR